MGSCFLDPKGNLIFPDRQDSIGVHEGLAYEILDDIYGDDFEKEVDIYEKHSYAYAYLEEELGYYRYSHWLGEHGHFSGEVKKRTHAQKLAIREFCRVNGATFNRVTYDG